MTPTQPPPGSVAASRAALVDTRLRIASTLDEIDRRVRPTAGHVSRGIAGLREARHGLEIVAAGASTVAHVRDVVRTARSLSRPQLALVAGGAAGIVGLLLWRAHAPDSSR